MTFSYRLASAMGLLSLALVSFLSIGVVSAQESPVEIETPRVVLEGVPFEAKVTDPSRRLADGAGSLRIGDRTWPFEIAEGAATIGQAVIVESGEEIAVLDNAGEQVATAEANVIPGWIALVPAIVAILIALALRQVIPALVLGIWLGASAAYGLSLGSLWHGLLDIITEHVLGALNDWGHLAIILFSLMIGGLVGIISKNGGTTGIVNAIVRLASSPKKGQVTTGILGTAIFFDDYANTLIVGNTMRPITDRLRISREKLAYIVDSTAAPVATIALVTTWIGFEVGLIGESVAQIDGYSESAYSVFLNSIAYSFYPLMALLFVFLVAGLGRDFGPMLGAERRARSEGAVTRPGATLGESESDAAEREPKAGQPQRALNAVIPILVLVIGTLVGIYTTGSKGLPDDARLREIVGNGDSYLAMMWSSMLAVLVAVVLSIGQRILTLVEVVDAWYAGVRAMLLAIIILVLAWSLANVNDVLHTGDYLVSILGDTISPAIVPTVVFILAAATAFATGSSWGVMGILMPLAIPLSWAILVANGMGDDGSGLHILYATVAAVMGGAVWGDHCSPISDTTILSSLASGCDHIDHVRTQMPYALGVGAVAVLGGTLPVGYGLPWWIMLPVMAVVLTLALMLFGHRTEEAPAGGPVKARPEALGT